MPILTLLLSAQVALGPMATIDATYTEITVVDVSPRPPASGILHTFVGILGRTGAGQIISFKLTYLGEGQPIPSVASLCTFKASGVPGPDPTTAIEISHFDCALSSDSPGVTPPIVRAQAFYN